MSFAAHVLANLLWAAQAGIREIKKTARTKQWPWKERSDISVK